MKNSLIECHGSEISNETIDEIIDIQKELSIFSELKDKGQNKASDGLLVSCHTQDNLKEYAENQSAFYIGRDEKGHANGYLLSCPAKMFLQKYDEKNLSFHQKRSDEEQIREMIRAGKFVYLDQIGVRFSTQKSGLAYELCQEFEKGHQGETVLVLIMSSPIDNIRSKKFFQSNHYDAFADIYFEKFASISHFKGILLIKELKG